MENQKQNNTGLIITIAILVIVIIALVFGLGSYIVINNMKNELEKQQTAQVQEDNDKEEQNNNIKDEQQEDEDESENIAENITDNVDNTNNVQNSKEENTTTNNVPEEKEFTPVEGLGNKYVDFDNRSFAINGKVYTLGKHTLQDMINDGVPFLENSLANANNNLNPNNESPSFRIKLDEYDYASVSFSNFSSENKKISECPLSEIYYDIDTSDDTSQNIVSFAFPFTITEQELVSQAGQPTEQSEYTGSNGNITRTLEYKIESTKYYGTRGYTFDFYNGVLTCISIDYLE